MRETPFTKGVSLRKNLERLRGLIFSQRVLLRLIDKGLTREEAYRIVQRNAMKVWEGKGDFKGLLVKDRDVMDRLSRREIEGCFDYKPYTRHVDYIFRRVFA